MSADVVLLREWLKRITVGPLEPGDDRYVPARERPGRGRQHLLHHRPARRPTHDPVALGAPWFRQDDRAAPAPATAPRRRLHCRRGRHARLRQPVISDRRRGVPDRRRPGVRRAAASRGGGEGARLRHPLPQFPGAGEGLLRRRSRELHRVERGRHRVDPRPEPGHRRQEGGEEQRTVRRRPPFPPGLPARRAVRGGQRLLPGAGGRPDRPASRLTGRGAHRRQSGEAARLLVGSGSVPA